jgi:hypothetical protein
MVKITVRPGLWRLSVVVPFVIVGGACIAIGVDQLTAHQPAQASFAAALWAPALLYCLLKLAGRQLRLEITESVVRARQGRWRGHPDREMPRNTMYDPLRPTGLRDELELQRARSLRRRRARDRLERNRAVSTR